MKRTSPQELLTELVASRSRGDVAAVMSCYETDAVIVTQPGEAKTGPFAVRAVLDYFASISATFTVVDRAFLEADGVALHLSVWNLRGCDPAGAEIRAIGRSSDVVRRQPDGSWLIAVDNPWGADDLMQGAIA